MLRCYDLSSQYQRCEGAVVDSSLEPDFRLTWMPSAEGLVPQAFDQAQTPSRR
jgi:hypothetical protein